MRIHRLLFLAALLAVTAAPVTSSATTFDLTSPAPACSPLAEGDDDPSPKSTHNIIVHNNGGFVHRYTSWAEATSYGHLVYPCNVQGDTVFRGESGDVLYLRIISMDPLNCDIFSVDGGHCRLTNILIDGVAIDLYNTATNDGYRFDINDMWSYAHGARVYALAVTCDTDHTVDIVFGPYFDDNLCESMKHVAVDDTTATTADMSWLAGCGTHTYTVRYGLSSDFDTENAAFTGPSQVDTITSHDTIVRHRLTGLTPQTDYVAYVQMNCDNGGWWYWWIGFATDESQESISDVEQTSARIYQRDGRVVVDGADRRTVTLYDAAGRTLSVKYNVDNADFEIPASGIYFVQIGNAPARRVAAIRQ